MGNIITLTTDFGTSDGYVAAMKGVILSINPSAIIVDISHDIEPQNIPQATYILNTAYRYFPQNTIHLVVVDPGVGSDRRAIILRTSSALFVAPDNGVLSYVAGEMIEAAVIKNDRFWLKPVSSTFHGRDIFAPVAAHLSIGQPLHLFGDRISDIKVLSDIGPKVDEQGRIIGQIIHIDRFGNLITNIGQSLLSGTDIEIEVKGRAIRGLSSSYIEGQELLALIGSNGSLEIAIKNGNAADSLDARIGDPVYIR